MSDILYQDSVLCLNAINMRLGWTDPASAFAMLMGESKDGSPPAKALDIIYNYNPDGEPIVAKMAGMTLYEWEYWMMLDPRKGDLDKVVHTSKRIIRVPTIIVCSHFHQMPKKEQKPTPRNIRRRDGNRCMYTNVELTNKTFSLDHVIPRSKGGKNTWENLASCHRDFNSKKGDKYNHEIGAKLRGKLVAPKSIPLCALHTEVKHPDHQFF